MIMINLLPPIEKERLRMEKVKRMVIVLWFLASFFLICLILVFFSIRIYIKSQLQTQQSIFSQARETDKKKAIEEFEARVGLMNLEIERIKNFYDSKVYFSDLAERISVVLPSGVYLNDISMDFVQDKNIVKVSLNGFSPSRDALLELKENMEMEEDFQNVHFPQSDWVKEFNIDFSIGLEIAVKK